MAAILNHKNKKQFKKETREGKQNHLSTRSNNSSFTLKNIQTDKTPKKRKGNNQLPITRKKRLFEDFPKEKIEPTIPCKKIQTDKTPKDKKRNLQLPITRKKRLFEDFPKETIEPISPSKEQYLAKLELAPPKKETVRLGYKIHGRNNLKNAFSYLMLTSERGQAILAINDKKFNMAASLDSNNKNCGTHEQEEQNHLCSGSNNSSFTLKNIQTDKTPKKRKGNNQLPIRRKKRLFEDFPKEKIEPTIPCKENALIPENNSACAKGHIPLYNWPRRERKIVHPQRGPSGIKKYNEEPTLLSKESIIHSWNRENCSKTSQTPDEWICNKSESCCQINSFNMETCSSAQTPEEWRDNESESGCLMSSLISLESDSTIKVRNNCSPTKHEYIIPKTQLEYQEKSYQNNESNFQEITSSEVGGSSLTLMERESLLRRTELLISNLLM